MKSASELTGRKVSDLGNVIEVGHEFAFEESYLSKSYDQKFETALDILKVDGETKEKYLESLKNLDRKRFVQERLALIGTVKEEMERLGNDITYNRRVSPSSDGKIFVWIDRCFVYQTVTPNRFCMEDDERRSFDTLVFGMRGIRSLDMVSRIEDDEYDKVVHYEDRPRKAVISTDGLTNIGLKYSHTEDGTGIIFSSSELPEEKNLRDSINKENSAH